MKVPQQQGPASASKAQAHSAPAQSKGDTSVSDFQDLRPEATAQRQLSSEISEANTNSIENNTGLPNQLKSGIENLSGHSLDDVKVHYNSGKPAQLNAHAYAQGSDIHVASGQEKHLPHEAWHVVQQKQGRVKPTMQMQGVAVNDDIGLEKEADVMGGRASKYRGLDKKSEGGISNPTKLVDRESVQLGGSSPIQKAGLVKGDAVPSLNSVMGNRFNAKSNLHSVNDFNNYEDAATTDLFTNVLPGVVVGATDLNNAAPNNQLDFLHGCISLALALAPNGTSYGGFDAFVAMFLTQKGTQHNQAYFADNTAAFNAAKAILNGHMANCRTTQINLMANAYQNSVPVDYYRALLNMDNTQEISLNNAKANYFVNDAKGNLNEPDSSTKAQWTKDIKKMPTVIKLLAGKLFEEPSDEIELADLNDQDQVSWIFPVAKDVKWYDDANDADGETVNSKKPIFKTLDSAWERIKKLVHGRVLNSSKAPGVRVVDKTESKFRAFQRASSQCIYIAKDEPVEVIVHEFGHHLENTIDSKLWLSLQRLLRTRNKDSNKLAGIGFSLFNKSEGRFKASMPVTGEYSARAYSSGDTEVMSMSMEYLSQPKKAKDLIEKDPQQAALIFKAIQPGEYNTACGNTYDNYTD